MEKITINVSIESSEKTVFQINATIDDKKQLIYFVEKDALKTVNIYDYKKHILKRDNERMYLEMPFKIGKTTRGEMSIKELDSTVSLEIYTEQIIEDRPNLFIDYILNGEKYHFEIKEQGRES